MTKAEQRAAKLRHYYIQERRRRLKAEHKRRQVERAAEQAAARAGPPRWLTAIPGPTAEELGIVQRSRDARLTT